MTTQGFCRFDIALHSRRQNEQPPKAERGQMSTCVCYALEAMVGASVVPALAGAHDRSNNAPQVAAHNVPCLWAHHL